MWWATKGFTKLVAWVKSKAWQGGHVHRRGKDASGLETSQKKFFQKKLWLPVIRESLFVSITKKITELFTGLFAKRSTDRLQPTNTMLHTMTETEQTAGLIICGGLLQVKTKKIETDTERLIGEKVVIIQYLLMCRYTLQGP